MEFFYMQLLVNALAARAEKAKARKQHSGEYDRTHSPEAYYITEEQWVNAATQHPRTTNE